jgi:tetratricopeptide (TPR) repeat protein
VASDTKLSSTQVPALARTKPLARPPHLPIWLLAGWLAGAALYAQSQVDVYFNIHPGVSNKAEVDLNLGEPLRKLEDQVFEYAPPRKVTDTQRVVVHFFPDSRQVARIDVYLKTPLDPELMRSQFGTRVMLRDREDGGIEELFYPKLHALVLAGRTPDAKATAISYLSARLLADIYVERCNRLMSEKRLDEAQTEADKAVVVDPDYARGYLAQAAYLSDQKNYDEAIVRYLAATNAKYSQRAKGMAHARLADLYWRQKGWLDKAQPEFQKAVAVAPDLDEGHLRYGQFLEAQKRGDEALAELSRAVDLNAQNTQARFQLAALLFNKGDLANALPHYAALSQWADSVSSSSANDNTKAGIYFSYGACLSRAGKSQPAIDAFTKALQKNPSLIQAYNSLGLEHQRAGNMEKAVESFRNGLKADSKNLALNQNLGNALLEGGKLQEARAQAESALGLKPDDAVQRFNVARCWGALAKKKQALYWVQQAVAGGFRDKSKLTGDHYLALLQKDGDFKKVLLQVQ